MACFKARCNALASVWYTVIVVALQAYLVYLGVERYRLYTDLKWPPGGYPSVWLSVYAGLYAACLPLLLLLFAFGVFKSGNIAGDNERLSDREERTIELRPNKSGEKGGCLHWLKSVWQHAPPFPQQIHVIVALLQCLAQQLMIAQLYKHGFINSGDFLNTEMDFLFQRSRQLATNLPMGDTRLQGFRITADELSGSPLAPNLLPLLMHVRLFGIPLEFLNLVLALVAYSIAYPAVFWRVNKCFSLLFSAHLFINGVCLVFSYLAFSVMFRIQETNIDSVRPVGLGQYFVHLKRFRVIYHPYAILGTFVGTAALTFLAPITLYAYGYNKYLLNVLNCQAKNNMRGGTSHGSEYTTYRGRSYRPAQAQLCCDGYCSHISAIILLAMIVFAKAPAIYALMIIYQNEEKLFLVVCIVTEVVYLFSWIILWIGLTLRREWNFNVLHRAHELYALQKGLTHGQVRLNTNPSQLKNAVILVHRDHTFVTDDQNVKQTLLRAIQQNNFEPKDETYWLKANGNQGSPAMRRIQLEGAMLRPEEGNRLLTGGGGGTLRRPSNDDQVVYHSVNRGGMMPGNPQQLSTPGYRGNSSPPHNDGNTFGTLQRNQQGNYSLQRQAGQGMQGGTLQRTMMNSSGQWAAPTESYASIHKQKDAQQGIYGRRGSQEDGSGFSAHSGTYAGLGQYATYARLPPQQSRLAGAQPNGGSSTLRLNGSSGSAYASQQQIGIRRPSDNTTPVVSIPSIRQSPLIGGDRTLDRTSVQRDSSPYATRTTAAGVKLSSFNNGSGPDGLGNGGRPGYGSVGGGVSWGGSSQRAPAGQPSQLLWNGQGQSTKPSMAALGGGSSLNGGGGGALSSSSSAQDAAGGCFTPTSTLTSQGSNYSSRTPTRGSPQHSSTFGRGGTNGLNGDGDADDGLFGGDGTLQRAPPPKPAIVTGSTSVRHTVKVVGGGTGTGTGRTDDSANFSLASSNGSGATANDYATSVV